MICMRPFRRKESYLVKSCRLMILTVLELYSSIYSSVMSKTILSNSCRVVCFDAGEILIKAVM
jgi:hypothetical protein